MCTLISSLEPTGSVISAPQNPGLRLDILDAFKLHIGIGTCPERATAVINADHSRPLWTRSFWSTLRIETSGPVQNGSPRFTDFLWNLTKRTLWACSENRVRPDIEIFGANHKEQGLWRTFFQIRFLVAAMRGTPNPPPPPTLCLRSKFSSRWKLKIKTSYWWWSRIAYGTITKCWTWPLMDQHFIQERVVLLILWQKWN